MGKKTILSLDNLSASRIHYFLINNLKQEGIDVDILLSTDTKDFQTNLRAYNNVSLFLIEPFNYYFNQEGINSELQPLLLNLRETCPVIIYTTHELSVITNHFGLQQGEHYDDYVSKKEFSHEGTKSSPSEQIINAIKKYLPKAD